MILALLAFDNQEYCTLIDKFLSLVLSFKFSIFLYQTVMNNLNIQIYDKLRIELNHKSVILHADPLIESMNST